MSEMGGEFIKYDVSKLSGKKDVLPQSIGDRVVLGSDNEGLYRRQISKLVGEIEDGKVLDTTNPDRSTQASKILKDNFNFETLEDLRDAQRDSNRREYTRDILKRSEERLAKAVLISLKKSGMAETDLVSPERIDDRLPEELKGLGEKVASFVITDEKIKGALKNVDLYRNGLQIDDYDQKKELVSGQIKLAIKEIQGSLNPTNIKQVELASNYLYSLQREVLRNREKESVTDEIVAFLEEHVIRRDVTVDEDLNLRNTHDGGDDFEKIPGEYTPEDYANYRNYRYPETVRWLKERDERASELIKICSGSEFESISQINEKLNEGGPLASRYTREDGTMGDKEYLEGLKDTLGFCFYEAIQDSKVGANIKILGTLHTHRVDRLLPVSMVGMSDNVVINAARDPFLREQIRSICLLDRDKKFRLLSIHGGFSDIETKKQLQSDITKIVEKITGDRRMGSDTSYTSEASRIRAWLLERNKVYQQLIDRQERIGRGGREMLPDDKEGRLKYARGLLDYVEDSGYPPGSLSVMDQCTALYQMQRSEMVEEEIKDEIHARLHLAYMYYHMHAAGGLLNNRNQSIEDAHEQGFKEGMLIDKRTLDWLIKNGANGHPVAECWNAIEDLNFGWENGIKTKDNDSYFRLLAKMVGIDIDKVRYKNGDRESNILWNESSVANKPLTVDNDEGKFLLTMKNNGLKFLGVKGELSDETYLAKWDEIANPYEVEGKRITYRQKFVGDFYKLQNPESFFWGKGAENAMRFNYFTDINVSRKEMVRDLILQRIKEKRELENKDKSEEDKLTTEMEILKKGFELAERLMEATAETSVFNACFAGHNDFSELILTEANTKDRQKKLKVIGARAAISKIVSFYTTWPRYIAGNRDSDRRSVFKPLYTEQIKTERMDDPKNDSYFLMAAILPKKILPVQAHFMKEDIGAKDVTSLEYWKKLYDPITKVISYGQDVLVDPDNQRRTIRVTNENKEYLSRMLRKMAVGGVLQLARRPTNELKWGDILKIENIVTTDYTIVDTIGAPRNTERFLEVEDWLHLTKDETFKKELEIKENAQELFKKEPGQGGFRK